MRLPQLRRRDESRRDRGWPGERGTVVVGLGLGGPGPRRARVCALAARVRPFLPLDGELTPVPDLGLGALPAARRASSGGLEAVCTAGHRARRAHVRQGVPGRRARAEGRLATAPDLVAYPRDEADVTAVLDWAAATASRWFPSAAAPRSSVASSVGTGRGRLSASTSVGCGALIEVDEVSLAARIRAGTLGPAIEDGLRPYGLTLRHFPQSFEFSTMGGWIATRAGGHYATGYTHIDDLVEAVRVVTPGRGGRSRCACRPRRPVRHPDRTVAGVRGHARRGHRGLGTGAATAAVPCGPARQFRRVRRAVVAAIRAVAQSGSAAGELPAARPARVDARRTHAPTGPAGCCLASSRPTTRSTARSTRAVEICREHRGEYRGRSTVGLR